MRLKFSVLCVLLFSAAAWGGFIDIPVGSGDATSHVLINFSDGANYQFDVSYDAASNPNGIDLLHEIAANTPLTLDEQDYSFGDEIIGMTYGTDTDDGFGSGEYDYWNYWTSDDGVNWTSSDVGASDITESNGSWDGWVYGNAFAPVPEPALGLSAAGALLFLRRRRRPALLLAAAGALSLPLPLRAADSVTIVPGSLTQGTVKASLTGGSYASESNNLGDWPLNTGGSAASTEAISFENPDFNGNADGGTPNTMIAFGNGGGVTLQFNSPITPVAGEKDLGIFTAQALSGGSGSFFNGDMDAAILVSADGNNWYTLTGQYVSNPTTYTGMTYSLNAPTMAYDFGTGATAWNYGAGTSTANLAALAIANYTTPMPDDTLFNNPASTDAQRLALTSDDSAADYSEIFGDSGGGNWFDVSGSGLSQIDYVRLNGDANDPSSGGVRLDAVFANANAVPEPSGLLVSLLGAFLLISRRS